MTRHVIRAAFINLVAGAILYPTAAKGEKAEAVTLAKGDRVTGPGEFSSDDKDQIDRLTKAGCLVPSDADSKAQAKAEAEREKATKAATAARTKADAARTEATRLRGLADNATDADKAKATKAADDAEAKATSAEAEAVSLEAAAKGD